MLEKRIESKVCQYAKQYGWEYVKQTGSRGDTDRYFINSQGRIIFVEFKNASGRLSKLQHRKIRRLLEKGFFTIVISSIEQGMELFDTLESLTNL